MALVVLEGVASSYERGTPVRTNAPSTGAFRSARHLLACFPFLPPTQAWDTGVKQIEYAPP